MIFVFDTFQFLKDGEMGKAGEGKYFIAMNKIKTYQS